MNLIKPFLIFCLLIMFFKVSGQYTESFSNIQFLNFQTKTSLTKEQALKVSSIVTNCANVLLARADISGMVKVYSNGPVDINEIKTKLTDSEGFKFSKPLQGTAVKADFLNSYALFLSPDKSEYTGEKPEKIIYSDPVKEEKVYGLAKTIWVELYPSKYSAQQPVKVENTEAEKMEKLMKESGVDFKSKQN